MSAHSLSERLLQALSQIHLTAPRIIAAPPPTPATGRAAGKAKRASVAIIVRVRPSSSASVSHYGQPGPSTSPTLQSFQDSSLLRPRTQSSASLSGASGAQSADTLIRLQDFFAQPWVQSGTPEILYIKRATRSSDRWSAQVAFPGGRQEPEDENSMYTAMRETWEEVGIDLAEKKDYLEIGRLDDREITTSLGKRLLMVLSPFGKRPKLSKKHACADAYVHSISTYVTCYAYTGFANQRGSICPLGTIDVSCVMQVLHDNRPLILFTVLAPHVRWGDVCIDITSRITPRSRFIRRILALLTGNMHFKCILLPNQPVLSPEPSPTQWDPPATAYERPPLSLWGLTLGMSLDLLSHMSLPETSEIKETIEADKLYGNNSLRFYSSLPPTPHSPFPTLLAPSMTSIFPTFSFPDINFFIWVFGFRYRHLLKRWNERIEYRQSLTGGRIPSADLQRPALRRNSSTNHNDAHGGRVNFAGMALNQFYAAVRKALIVAVVLRACVVFGGLGAGTFWLIRKLKERRRRIVL